MFARSGSPDYDARIERAKYLAVQHPFAAEVLTFYERLATFQKNLYSEIRQEWGGQRPSDPLRSQPNLVILMAHFPGFLSFLESAGPAPVAEAARQLSSRGPSAWMSSLGDFWNFGGRQRQSADGIQDQSAEALREFILRAFLQPHVEFVAEGMAAPTVDTTHCRCPRCDSAPVIGVLRPEGDGGKRCLVCSFCQREWDFRRILCPACGEEAESKLPIYVADQFSHVRIEACDTCKSYLPTIDLTKNGRANPIVDDLATIPLSLWAREHGYTRLQPNLLGT